LSHSTTLERDLAIGSISVRPSVRLSVTHLYRLKTNNRRIMRFSASVVQGL